MNLLRPQRVLLYRIAKRRAALALLQPILAQRVASPAGMWHPSECRCGSCKAPRYFTSSAQERDAMLKRFEDAVRREAECE